MDALIQDVRYALRMLRRAPGYTMVVVLTLALGIAANTTVFSVLNPYLLRPLPFAEADRLVQIGQVDPVSGWDGARFSLPQLEDWRARTRAFEDIAAYHYGNRNLTGDGGAERVLVGYVTGNLFPLLGAQPALGRVIVPSDDEPGNAGVVVLGHGLWTRRYGADPGIVGRTIRIDGEAFTVVGVMGPDFNFPWNEVRMWVPMGLDPAREPRTDTYHIPVGRLADGWTMERARQELIGIQRELAALYPDVEGRFAGVSVKPLREALNFRYDVVRNGFILLLAAVGAVLLIACVNVAGLVLARSTARARDVAVRMALGARRGRLVQQMLAESAVLALAGGAVGVWLAWLAIDMIGPRLPESLYRVGTATVDGRVLLFSAALTLATPILFGLSPAFAATRADLASAMKESGRGAGAGRGATRGRRALVVAQVALAVVLVTTAGLMIRSFAAVSRVDLGFDAEPLLTVEVAPPAADYPSVEAVERFFQRATDAIVALPGVRAASATAWLPLNHETPTLKFATPAGAGAPAEEWPVAIQGRIAPGYFEAMRIRLVAGRDFGVADGPDAPPVAIVSRSLAERHWPGEVPVGKTLLLEAGDEPVTVVGVVEDVRHEGIAEASRPQLYFPVTQVPARRRFIVAAAEGGAPASLARAVREAIASVDPNVPATTRPMTEIVRENDFQWRFGSAALGAFGGVALMLAALGVYGLVAYNVVQRRREMGVRMALGATAAQLRRLVIGEGIRLTGAGLAIGIVLSLAVARLLASQLFGVRPFDPTTLAVVPVLFAVVAALASARPAARAAALQPREVLAEE
ncbi:MAG TPA: ABC transporter permease [Longimicrobiales bacterium]